MAVVDNAAGITIDATGQHNNAKLLDGLPAASATGQALRWDEYVATKTGTFPIVSTSFASGATQPTTITDAAMAGITGVSTAGGKTGTGATDGTLGVVAGSFASSGAETGTGGTQGGLGSAAGANQPYNTTDFPGGRYAGIFTKNGKDVLLAQMLSTALTDLDAVVTPFFAFRSDAAADSKWRVWWYYTRSSDGLLVPFTPTTSVTGQLSCPQVALTTTLPASAGFTNEVAGAGVNQLPAGLVGDLQTLGTAAIGTTGRYADAAHVHPSTYVDAAITTVAAATTAALPAYTVSGGSAAGSTLTANANGAFPTLDGWATLTAAATGEAVSARFLLHNGASAVDNGPYVLTQQGDAGTPWIAVRYTGLDTAAKIVGSQIRVQKGNQKAGAVYEYQARAAITMGTTSLFWWRTDLNASPNELRRLCNTDFEWGVVNPTAGSINPDGFNNSIAGTASNAILAQSGTASRNGVLSQSVTTSTARASMAQNFSAIQELIGTNVGLHLAIKCGLPVLSDGTNTFSVHAGLFDSFTTPPTNGIGVTFQPAISTTDWQITTANAGTVTNTGSGRTIVAATDDHFVLHKDPGDNTIYAYVNGTALTAITANLPLTNPVGLMLQILKSVGNVTARTFETDFIRCDIYTPLMRAA